MPSRPRKPPKRKKQDPTGKARAAKRAAAGRKAVTKKTEQGRWGGEWWTRKE